MSKARELSELGDKITIDGSGNSTFDGDVSAANLSTTGNVTVTGTVDGRDVAADGSKLDGIEVGADVTDTANVTAAGALMDSEVTNLAAVKAFDPTDYATAAQGTLAASALQSSDIGVSVQAYSAVLAGTTASFTTAEESKLSGIEAGATADQTAAEIKTAYESNANTNAFTDAEKTKLSGVETGADVTDTANVTAAGALMDSELADITAVKTLNQSLTTTSSPTFKDLNINDTTGYGSIEIGGPSGGYIDLKSPFSDDFDGRIITTGANLEITTSATGGGVVRLQHQGATKLSTTSTGVSVTGTVAATAFTGDGSALTGISTDPYDSTTTSTGFFAIPAGTTAQRPASPAVGMVRYNTTESSYELYDGTAWKVWDSSSYPYAVEYLVIAGGGGGGQDSDGGGMGGGGGAGGYRNSYASETSGGNSSTETPISVAPGTQYTITVGAGGSPNAKGGDSTFATITSVGGGRGPSKNTATSALNGGSGGGGPRDGGNGGAGTTGQGFRGGNTAYGAWQGASGGGGAGQVGQVGASNGSPQGEIAGNGGNGLSSSITGSAVTRAGGGGGYNSGAGAGGNGGAGGGGNGGWRASYSGSSRSSTSGSVNTGSGGGGNQNSASSGGSGVVILRIPTAKYSGVTTGSPTVTTVGSDTVLVFNSSGTYTA